MRFGDTPESKVREWVAKKNRITEIQEGRKGAYRAIVLADIIITTTTKGGHRPHHGSGI
jgi:hypothetical protein